MSFEEITIVIALIMLIICFIVVIVMIYNSKGSKAFPVRISRCPDYYRFDSEFDSGSGICKPIISGGNDYGPLNLNPSLKNICDHKKQLKRDNLLMDGITNRNFDCFDII